MVVSRLSCGLVSGCGVPPASVSEETSPCPAWRMLPSGPNWRRANGPLHRVMAVPPTTEIFFARWGKPIRLSGRKNGSSAPSVPISAVAVG